MISVILAIVGLVINVGVLIWLVRRLENRPVTITSIRDPMVKQVYDAQQKLQNELDDRSKELKQLPKKVTDSITSSTANYKGKYGELVSYVSLMSEYDRIIPLGDIVDFLCIKFSTDKAPGTVDMVEIKNGKYAKLSTDQSKLKKLLKGNQNCRFVTIHIDASPPNKNSA